MPYVELRIDVDVEVNNRDAIDRCVENHPAPSIASPEARWRDQFFDLHTEEDVLEHLAASCISAGVNDASRLDGWADLGRGEVTMFVTDIYPD